jgi:hypothetical protein
MNAEAGSGLWMRRLLVGLAALFILVQGGRTAAGLSANSAFEFGRAAIGASTSKADCDVFGGGENAPAHSAGDCLACCLCCSNSGPGSSPLARIPDLVSYDPASLTPSSQLTRPDFAELEKLRPDWISGSGSPRAPPLLF